MFWLIKRATCGALGAMLLIGCAGKQSVTQQNSFYNVDSLVNAQLKFLEKRQLDKTVSIGEKQEQSKLTPDSLQWANELDIFRSIGQVNKASFRDAYSVSDMRDTNSNLMVREIRAKREVPVPLVKLYYLRTPGDLRKIEATLVEDNVLYTNTRRLVLELERNHELHHYRVEGFQKMTVGDSVRFIIEGTIE